MFTHNGRMEHYIPGSFLTMSAQKRFTLIFHSSAVSSDDWLLGGTTSKNRARKLIESSDNVKVNRKGGNK